MGFASAAEDYRWYRRLKVAFPYIRHIENPFCRAFGARTFGGNLPQGIHLFRPPPSPGKDAMLQSTAPNVALTLFSLCSSTDKHQLCQLRQPRHLNPSQMGLEEPPPESPVQFSPETLQVTDWN